MKTKALTENEFYEMIERNKRKQKRKSKNQKLEMNMKR